MAWKTAVLLAVATHVLNVSAHGRLGGIIHKGTKYGGCGGSAGDAKNTDTVAWPMPGNPDSNPLFWQDLLKPDGICNAGAVPAAGAIQVKIHDELTMQFSGDVRNHGGEVTCMMAKCNGKCADADKTKLEWFTTSRDGFISESPHHTQQGDWASKLLSRNNNQWKCTVPKLACGQYAFRFQIVGMHQLGPKGTGSPQMFPGCFNVEIPCDGSTEGNPLPGGIVGQKLYQVNHPGLWTDLYKQVGRYPFACPAVPKVLRGEPKSNNGMKEGRNGDVYLQEEAYKQWIPDGYPVTWKQSDMDKDDDGPVANSPPSTPSKPSSSATVTADAVEKSEAPKVVEKEDNEKDSYTAEVSPKSTEDSYKSESSPKDTEVSPKDSPKSTEDSYKSEASPKGTEVKKDAEVKNNVEADKDSYKPVASTPKDTNVKQDAEEEKDSYTPVVNTPKDTNVKQDAEVKKDDEEQDYSPAKTTPSPAQCAPVTVTSTATVTVTAGASPTKKNGSAGPTNNTRPRRREYRYNW